MSYLQTCHGAYADRRCSHGKGKYPIDLMVFGDDHLYRCRACHEERLEIKAQDALTREDLFQRVDELQDRICELETAISDALVTTNAPGDTLPTIRQLEQALGEIASTLYAVTREGKAARRREALEAPEPIAPGDYRYFDGRGREAGLDCEGQA